MDIAKIIQRAVQNALNTLLRNNHRFSVNGTKNTTTDVTDSSDDEVSIKELEHPQRQKQQNVKMPPFSGRGTENLVC